MARRPHDECTNTIFYSFLALVVSGQFIKFIRLLMTSYKFMNDNFFQSRGQQSSSGGGSSVVAASGRRPRRQRRRQNPSRQDAKVDEQPGESVGHEF